MAEGLVRTAWKLLTDNAVAVQVKEEFEKDKQDRRAADTEISMADLGSFDGDYFSKAGIIPQCSYGHLQQSSF